MVCGVVRVGRFLSIVMVFFAQGKQLAYAGEVVGTDVTGEESVMADPMEAGW